MRVIYSTVSISDDKIDCYIQDCKDMYDELHQYKHGR